jgi:hypothetical protein
MIGRVKNLSRFGIFVTFSASDLSRLDTPISEGDSNKAVLTGLIRWSDVPKNEKYHKNETIAITIKEIHANGKIDLILTPENFLEKYDNTLARTLEVLQALQGRNQEVRKG